MFTSRSSSPWFFVAVCFELNLLQWNSTQMRISPDVPLFIEDGHRESSAPFIQDGHSENERINGPAALEMVEDVETLVKDVITPLRTSVDSLAASRRRFPSESQRTNFVHAGWLFTPAFPRDVTPPLQWLSEI
ncbi:hypothetical protein KIN20_015980 [Parelaphostrongylus tenuis]|uniref:Uncharacterized protein n=1 Tax=Parelaphostrongylus tenuis TaxID=148309 RepID=A0AAD5N4S7_PARTN|nr:hypothetical protein KIN20_015980 [Parelaphostrongylus tenuis]